MKKSVWKKCALKSGQTYSVLKKVAFSQVELNPNERFKFIQTTQNYKTGITNFLFLNENHQIVTIEIPDSVANAGLTEIFALSSDPIKEKNKSNLLIILFIVGILGIVIKFVLMFPNMKEGIMDNPMLALLGAGLGLLYYKIKNIKR
ncbi:hypothetical protein [Desulfosediminicola sp.]|uniref:hypothetical protein n=1 Tax=Desulfosediminicola sp. TaxID=2886825 RepID=UPI003AF209AB